MEQRRTQTGLNIPALVQSAGYPRLIITAFLLALMVYAAVLDLPIGQLVSSILVRFGMNGILVLAMIPSIQSGTGPNFGISLGIVCGLVAATLSIELDLVGLAAFFFAVAVSAILGSLVGYVYGLLLNRVKGQEMTVGTYTGFSVVSLMCVFWLMAPYKSPEMIWPYGGEGLRVTITLQNRFDKVLNELLAFDVVGVRIPTGLLIFLAICCALMWVFLRTKTGMAMLAVGSNPRFAASSGINVDKFRLVGTVLSTVLGAVGIVVYAQSYGFLQLYTAPLYMPFFAVASILIGGASIKHATIMQALVGTFLFQALLVVALPVANEAIANNLSEVIRIILSNGMILYALTRKEAGGDLG
ncbi:MAG: ABC transporter permease [Bacillota bacterium]